MDKFSRLANALLTVCKKNHPCLSNLPRPIVRDEMDFYRPLDIKDTPWELFAEPTGPIDAAFLDRFLTGTLKRHEERKIGFGEHSSRPELIERTVLEVLGTILSCQLAFNHGIASNVAGGTHHASRDGGAGYTILNDLAIAAIFEQMRT